MYFFSMTKSATCLLSRTTGIKLTTATANYCVAQNTQMIQDERTLGKNSNTSLHLKALVVQTIE